MIKNIIYIVILNIIFISCKKEETCNPNSNLQANLTAEQQQKLIAEFANYQPNNNNIPQADRVFYAQLRTLANDVEAYYKDVSDSMTLEEKYEKLKYNLRNRINHVSQLSDIQYNNSNAYRTLSKNSFVLMTYDALQRNNAEMLWTNLGIFAANEVRAGVVLAFDVANTLHESNINIYIGNPRQNMKDILIQSTELLIEGQVNVVVDIGALVLLNKYVHTDLDGENWLTQEAIQAFKYQKQAEQALACGQKEKYQDLQTQAAIEFGAHEQIYILQPIWDKPLLKSFSVINELILDMTKHDGAFFGEIFIGANKYIEPKQGHTIKIPYIVDDLVIASQRVDIARNGFNTYNKLRKNGDWAYWIDKAQIRLGYGIDVYYPSKKLSI
jgi:hypothetical protein